MVHLYKFWHFHHYYQSALLLFNGSFETWDGTVWYRYISRIVSGARSKSKHRIHTLQLHSIYCLEKFLQLGFIVYHRLQIEDYIYGAQFTYKTIYAM